MNDKILFITRCTLFIIAKDNMTRSDKRVIKNNSAIYLSNNTFIKEIKLEKQQCAHSKN